MLKRAFLLWCIAGLAHAAPNTQPADDIGKYLNDTGVSAQLGQIRQQVGSTASDLVMNAVNFLGVPYRRGGTNAETGFDCSKPPPQKKLIELTFALEIWFFSTQ
jgi:hypothetical protein